MRTWLVALMLAWCAIDFSGRVYACFGFDLQSCQNFAQLYSGGGVLLSCEMK